MRGDVRRALLDREMTRKEFLQIVGGSLVVLFGVANFIKLMQQYAQPNAAKNQAASQASKGFGSRKFGV